MEGGNMQRGHIGHGKKRCIDCTTLAKSFVKWNDEKQLSVYDVSSLWGRVCEDVNWPNTKKNDMD